VGKERLLELDAFRGIAALAVVLFHYTTRFEQIFSIQGSMPFTVPLGYFGVNFFFIISGFVILMTVERSATLRQFVLSRFSRLYPVYWLAVSLTFWIVYFFPFSQGKVSQGLDIQAPISLATYLINLTMLQGFLKWPNVDGAYWSLAYELGFYIAMATFLWRRKLEKLYVAAWLALAGQWLFALAPGTIPHPLHLVLVLNGYSYLFVAGLALFRLNNDWSSRSWWLLLAGCLFSNCLWFWHQGDAAHAWFFAAFIALFILGLKGHLLFLRWPPFRWLGSISYSLYLIHEVVGWRLILGFYSIGLVHVYAMPLTILLILLIATLMTRLVEQPALRWLRSTLGGRKVAGLPLTGD
jgi:peptidoglycan/LPS O-acetylase OafA/YrhL